MAVPNETSILGVATDVFYESYPLLLETVLERGRKVAPRNQLTYEVTPLIFSLNNPRESIRLQKIRRLNYAYAIIEKLSLIHGIADPETFCYYIPALEGLLEKGEFGGAYGPRVTAQIDHIYRLLKKDPDSRRALITIYSSQSDHRLSPDIPCTVSLQFLLRENRLNLLVNMRSSDVYLGLPYDVQQFTFLQQLMANWLEVELGTYMHVAGSGHIYEKDIPSVMRVLKDRHRLNFQNEPLIDLGYENARQQVQTFFEIEAQLRNGVIASPTASPVYESLCEYLQICLGKVSSYIRRRFADRAELSQPLSV